MTINNSCSILYYPGQDIKFGFLTGHVDLEFEGNVYTFSSGCQSRSQINKRIDRATKGGLPFERFSLHLTDEQSRCLRKILTSQNEPKKHSPKYLEFLATFYGQRLAQLISSQEKNPSIPFGVTCMHHVSNVLSKAQIIRIPYIINLSPMLSSTYLRGMHSFKLEQVADITSYGDSYSSLRNFLTVNLCRLGESTTLTIPMILLIIKRDKIKELLQKALLSIFVNCSRSFFSMNDEEGFINQTLKPIGALSYLF